MTLLEKNRTGSNGHWTIMAPKLQNHIIDKGWVSTYVISLFWQIALNIRKWWLAKMRNTCHDWSEIHCVSVGRRVNAGDVTSPFVVFENCSIIHSSINFIFSVLPTLFITLDHFQQILILHKFWRRQALTPKISTCRLAPPIFAPLWLWSSHNLRKCDC